MAKYISTERMYEVGKISNNSNFQTEHDNVIALEVDNKAVLEYVNGHYRSRDVKVVRIRFANKNSRILNKVMTGKIANCKGFVRIMSGADENGYLSEMFNVWNDSATETKEELTLKRAVAFFGTMTDDVTGKYMFKIVSPKRLEKYQALVDAELMRRDSAIQANNRKHIETFSKFTQEEIDSIYATISIEK